MTYIKHYDENGELLNPIPNGMVLSAGRLVPYEKWKEFNRNQLKKGNASIFKTQIKPIRSGI